MHTHTRLTMNYDVRIKMEIIEPNLFEGTSGDPWVLLGSPSLKMSAFWIGEGKKHMLTTHTPS